MNHTQVFVHRQPFVLESGEILKDLTLGYTAYGKLNAQKNNVIWVLHALTGNSEAADWWEILFGKGKILDPERYFIICANNLGSCYGSSNPLSENPDTGQAYYYDFPLITTRDMAKAFDLLRRHLELPSLYLGIGGSMGAQILLEWTVEYPKVFEHIVPIAGNAFHSPWGIAFNESQRMAIEADASWGEKQPDAGKKGLAAARAAALLSYRNYETYAQTQQENSSQTSTGFRASSYQRYQGQKLVNRFNAFSYWTLSKAMDAHHLGRNRGDAIKALTSVQAKTLSVGIRSDLLFPPSEQRFIAEHIKHAEYAEIESLYGHDGFLIEPELNGLVQGFLNKRNKENNFLLSLNAIL